MINEIMEQINNYFSRTVESNGSIISGSTISGSFRETYLTGQFIRLQHTILNDGVYKVVSLVGNVLTVEETLIDETPVETYLIWGLAPPKDFLNLVNEINTYETSQTQVGIVSESQGSRSVSFGSSNGDNSNWESVFKRRLNRYRKVYSDDHRLFRRFNINTKDCW